MSTITLPNIRVSSDLTVSLTLKDGGVAIDWSTLDNIKVSIYSDAQRALAGRCTASVDEEDNTLLVCQYAASKPQYLGINRVIVQATYMGETKTYDKPAFNFVRWTDDQEGQTITIDDPDVDVEIEVEDVSSSILDAAIAAALQAAADAEAAAHLVPLQVLEDCVEATADANEAKTAANGAAEAATEAAAAANAAGITSASATVDANVGTPAVSVDLTNKHLTLAFANMKGETGATGATGATPAFSIGDVTTGAAGSSAAATITGTAAAPVLNLTIPKGDKGDQGNTGSSVDYAYELVNNLTTNDATKGLSAAMGVTLEGEVSQLEAEVNGDTILSFTGAQGFRDITELANDTEVVISLSGGVENLRQIAFLHNWSQLGAALIPDGRTKIIVTIPATCNKIGFYEVSGTTLNISVTIKTNSISERLTTAESDIVSLEDLASRGQRGLAINGALSADELAFWSAVKSVAYYDADNPGAGVMYVRMFGFFTTFIQITLTPDKSTMYDFRADATARPSGIKSYHLFNGKKEVVLTFDWDAYTTNFSNTNYNFSVDNATYTDIIAPLNANLQEQIDEIREGQEGTSEDLGFSGTTNEQAVPNTVICPVKKASKDGKIESIYLKSQNAGNIILYVGEIDQLYLFIARESYEINVSAGEQTIDVSDRNIYVFAGEQVAMKCNGNRYLVITDGTPEGDDSFYYGDTLTGLQLQAYTVNTKKIQFSFKVTLQESDTIALEGAVERNTKAIQALNSEIGYVKSNLNIVSDTSGNKYRMVVVNGDIRAFALNFSHIMAVGNSYTIHPTTTDTGDLATSLWWGHWAMAASRKETSWPSLLQTAIRQKNNSAKVTPVFGRRYETGIRTLSDNDAFIYWEDSQWKNLKPNVSAFSDVDCVLFFLGDNYTAGSGWYEIYKPMVLQFISWFPNATIVCCSCRIREANNDAIAQVANEVSAVYVSMYGLGGASKLGNYVSGDDGNLHQIANSAVAGHFGDYGEWMILDRIVNAIGYENNATLYNIGITNPTGVTLSVKDSKTVEGAIVSVFADIIEGYSLTGITVTSGGNAVTVTDHGVTDYGRVFTFQMPAGDVAIVGA